ncbi:uncharacterized protein J3R85_005894 [Psidium guajava]|nr:uncharacterized protein J3R85_005894 [Psidium guajava]
MNEELTARGNGNGSEHWTPWLSANQGSSARSENREGRVFTCVLLICSKKLQNKNTSSFNIDLPCSYH